MFPHFKLKKSTNDIFYQKYLINKNSKSYYQSDKDYKSLYYKYNFENQNSTSDIFYQKYCKYKKKYLNLKKLIGGSEFNDDDNLNEKKNNSIVDSNSDNVVESKSDKSDAIDLNIKKINDELINENNTIISILNQEIIQNENIISEKKKELKDLQEFCRKRDTDKKCVSPFNYVDVDDIEKIIANLQKDNEIKHREIQLTVILNKKLFYQIYLKFINEVKEEIQKIKNDLVSSEKDYYKNINLKDKIRDLTKLSDKAYDHLETIIDDSIINSIKFYNSYIEDNSQKYNVNLISTHYYGPGIKYTKSKYYKVPNNIILIFMTTINRYGYQDTLEETLDLFNKLNTYGKNSVNPFNFRNEENSCLNNRQIILPGQHYLNIHLSPDNDQTNPGFTSHGVYDNENIKIPELSKYSLQKGLGTPLNNVLEIISQQNKDTNTIVYVSTCRICQTQDIEKRFQLMLIEELLQEINKIVAKSLKLEINSSDENCNYDALTTREHYLTRESSIESTADELERVYSNIPMSPNKDVYKIIAPIIKFNFIGGNDFSKWETEIIKSIDTAINLKKNEEPKLLENLQELRIKIKNIFSNNNLEEFENIVKKIIEKNNIKFKSEISKNFKIFYENFRIDSNDEIKSYYEDKIKNTSKGSDIIKIKKFDSDFRLKTSRFIIDSDSEDDNSEDLEVYMNYDSGDFNDY